MCMLNQFDDEKYEARGEEQKCGGGQSARGNKKIKSKLINVKK